MVKIEKYNKLKELYKKYIIPVYKNRNFSKDDLNSRIKNICKKLKLKFTEEDGIITVEDNVMKVIEKSFVTRYKFSKNEITLYSVDEVELILNIGKHLSSRLIRENYACTAYGKDYAYTEKIDEIKLLLDEYKGLSYLIQVIQEEEDMEYISEKLMKNYIIKYCDKINNPLKKEKLYKLKDLPKVIKHLNEIINNRKQKQNRNQVLYRKTFGKKIENVDKQYIEQNYYTKEELTKIFSLKDLKNIEEKIGFYYISSKKFYKKQEIDLMIKNINDNFIPLIYIRKHFNISHTSIINFVNELDIKLYAAENILGFSCLVKPREATKNLKFIKKDDSEILYKHIKEKTEKRLLIDNTKDRYSRYLLKRKNIEIHKNIENTIIHYNKFVLERLEKTTKEESSFVGVYKILCENLYKEITLYNDKEIKSLLQKASYIEYEREMSLFLNYTKENYLTKYNEVYVYSNFSKTRIEPYTKQQWLNFGKLIFDMNSTSFKTQLNKAIDCREYCGVWFYSAFHYICTWRRGDILTKIPNPKLEILGLDEFKFIETVKNGLFDINMAQCLVNELIKEIKSLNKSPGKTTNNARVAKAFLKIVVHEDYTFIIGLLLGLCEVHRRLDLKHIQSILYKDMIAKYENYIGVFGNKYLEIFGEKSFSNVKAIKAHLQYGKILIDSPCNDHIMGIYSNYNLMSILKSHSRTDITNEISNTTEIYLMSELNEFDFDKVMLCIEKRGIFGCLYHLMAQIVLDKNYLMEPVESQNNLIFEHLKLDSPIQVEKISKAIYDNKIKAKYVLDQIIKNKKIQDKEDIKKILISLANGEYPSKMEYSQCILKSIDKRKCAYPSKIDCIGCEYLIPEILFLMEFNNSLNILLKNLEDAYYSFDKQRYLYMFQNKYIPTLIEAISVFGIDRIDLFIDRKSFYKKIKDLNI